MTTPTAARGLLGRVVKDLENRILEGSWRERTRLPSERALAESHGVSRATVREAIQRLVARGLLETRRGSGVFVVGAQPARASAPWLQLIAQSVPMRSDTLEFRLIFECASARFAAERASADELAAMADILERMKKAVHARKVDEEAATDAAFHAALARASHNIMLDHFHASVITLLREHIISNTYDAARDSANARQRALARLAQHQRVFEAVRARQPQAAFEAMREHLDFVGRQFPGDG